MTGETKTVVRRIDRDMVMTLIAVLVLMGGFAAFLLNRAEAQTQPAIDAAKDAKAAVKEIDAGIRAEVRQLREDFEARQRRIEDKVDRVLEKLDRRR